MENEHWSSTFEHESLAEPEARESFTKAMGKYDSPEAAVLGNYEQQKIIGKPYRLPESVDKLPEDVRSEFTSNARKVLGLEGVKGIEDLKDLDMKIGLPEEAQVNEELAGTFKKFVVDNGITKAGAQKLLEFNNTLVSQAMKESQERHRQAIEETNKALVSHFGSEDKVKERSELVKRFYRDHAGLSAEEFEQIGGEIANIISRSPVLARVHLEKIADLAGEGSTDAGTGGTKGTFKPLSEQIQEEAPATSKALGWDK